jgi:hypothetical protein
MVGAIESRQDGAALQPVVIIIVGVSDAGKTLSGSCWWMSSDASFTTRTITTLRPIAKRCAPAPRSRMPIARRGLPR